MPTVSAARAAFVARALAVHAAPFTSPAARLLHILYSLHAYADTRAMYDIRYGPETLRFRSHQIYRWSTLVALANLSSPL